MHDYVRKSLLMWFCSLRLSAKATRPPTRRRVRLKNAAEMSPHLLRDLGQCDVDDTRRRLR